MTSNFFAWRDAPRHAKNLLVSFLLFFFFFFFPLLPSLDTVAHHYVNCADALKLQLEEREKRKVKDP